MTETKPVVVTTHVGMFRAITTRFLGPTNCRGARIKADAGDGKTITIPFNHSLASGETHAEAARMLCEKMGWSGHLVSGGVDGGNQVFVFVDGSSLQPETVAVECASREDAVWLYKQLYKQCGNPEQTFAGRSAGIACTSIQRARKVGIGGSQALM